MSEREKRRGPETHNRQLLLALSQAALRVQRARRPQEIHQAVGTEVRKLGYHAVIFAMSDDRQSLKVDYLSIETGLLKAAEKLAGLSAREARVPLEPGTAPLQAINQGQAIFIDNVAQSLSATLPRLARHAAAPLAAMLGLEEAIYAPLIVSGEAVGLLEVVGRGLTEADVPAMTVFANQIAIALENARLMQAVRDSEEHFRTLIENSSDIVTVMDQVGTLRYQSPSVRRVLGFEPEEMVGRSAFDFVHPQDLPGVRRAIGRVMRDPSQTHAVQFRFRHRDGSWRLLEGIGRQAPNDRNEIVVNSRDITERVLTQQALDESKRRFQNVLESLNLMVWAATADGSEFLYCNDAAEWVYGRPASDFFENPYLWAEVIHPDDRDWVLADADELLERGESRAEYRIVRPDGEVRWISDRKHVTYSDEGEPLRIGGVASDITERKEMEEARREQQAFLESIYEGVELAIFVVDVSEEGDFTFAGLNPAHERLSGLKSEQVQGKRPEELAPFIPEEATQAIRSNYARCLETGEAIEYEEMIPMGGRETWWLTRLTPLKDQKGDIYRIVGSSMSITERKRAEEALRSAHDALEERVKERTLELERSEEMMRSMINAITESAFLTDPDGRILAANETIARRLGVSVQEMVGQNIYPYLPDDVASSREAMAREVVRTGEAVQFEDRRLGRVTRNSIYPILDADGTVERLAVFGYDVTDWVEAEEKIKRQRERFLTLLENFPEILYVVDPETHCVLFVNQAFKDLLGKDPVGGTCYKEFQGLEAPCDFCTNEIILQEKKPYTWEHHNPILGQTYQITDQIIKWPDGRDVRFEVAVDITERKEAKETLARRMEEMERFNRMAVGREMRMIELKRQVNELSEELGKGAVYTLSFLEGNQPDDVREGGEGKP